MGRRPSENPVNVRIVGYFTKSEAAHVREKMKEAFPRLKESARVREILIQWAGEIKSNPGPAEVFPDWRKGGTIAAEGSPEPTKPGQRSRKKGD